MPGSTRAYLPKEVIVDGYDVHVVFCSAREPEAAVFFNEFMDFVKDQCIVHDRAVIFTEPVGPWPGPMWQVLLRNTASFADLERDLGKCLAWLMINRGDFSVMVHPNTERHGPFGGAYRDHTDYSLWLGRPLELRLDIFKSA